MTYNIPENKLADLLTTATKLVVRKTLEELGIQKSQISQREAYNRFGRPRVIKWRMNGKVNPVKIGSIIYYDVHKLEILASSNDLSTGMKANKKEDK